MTGAAVVQVVEMPLPDLVRVDLGWWKVAGYDLVQVSRPVRRWARHGSSGAVTTSCTPPTRCPRRASGS